MIKALKTEPFIRASALRGARMGHFAVNCRHCADPLCASKRGVVITE